MAWGAAHALSRYDTAVSLFGTGLAPSDSYGKRSPMLMIDVSGRIVCMPPKDDKASD